MSLKDKITEDLTSAMKLRDAFRTETLRSIRAEILKMDKSGMDREMNADEETQLLMRQVKMRRESKEIFEAAGRMELAEKEMKQLAIINEYLPKQIPADEAEKIINSIISDSGATTIKDIGKVMGLVMKELKGKFDGKLIQEIVKRRLTA